MKEKGHLLMVSETIFAAIIGNFDDLFDKIGVFKLMEFEEVKEVQSSHCLYIGTYDRESFIKGMDSKEKHEFLQKAVTEGAFAESVSLRLYLVPEKRDVWCKLVIDETHDMTKLPEGITLYCVFTKMVEIQSVKCH